MSKARSSYLRAILIMLAVASISAVALAQTDSSALRFQPSAPITFMSPSGSNVYVNGNIASLSSMSANTPNSDGTLVADAEAATLPDAPSASGQQTPMKATPPPPQVSEVTSRMKYEARRWHVGGRIGVGFSPELFMFGLQAQFGPIFTRRLLFRPNADFSFGELTNMFALNLEGVYQLRTGFNRWSPYFGMGPSLNFIHQGTSKSDVSFSDFTYKTGFNVLIGGQKGRTFVEMKTSLWSDPAPVLRLLVGYNF